MEQILPPVLDYAFLSSPDSPETYIISRNGAVRHWQEGVEAGLLVQRRKQPLPELFRIADAASLPWRWRKGYLPILEIGENTLYARGDELRVRTPQWCRRFPSGEALESAEFDKGAKALEEYWDHWLSSGRVLPPMGEKLDAAWRMSLIHSRCAFSGRHPKYGVEKYGEFRADGFPPTIIAICNTFLEFEHTAEARELFSYYLKRFVRSNGTIDYYGSSFAEYGMLLKTAAALCAPEGGEGYFDSIKEFLTLLCRYIYNVMNPWIAEPGSYYYLPCGSPEADRRKDKGEYFHNAAWLWRGMSEVEKQCGSLMEKEERWELRHAAETLKRRLDRAWNDRRAALKGFPPYAIHQEKPFEDTAESVETAYANYRYYPEMLSSGAFDKDSMAAMVKVRENCKGEIAGMTRFYWHDYPEELTDHWTVASCAQGLLELRDKKRYMALLEAHLCSYISPDLFYAYESVTVKGDPRLAYSDWCIPAQLALPRMLMWSFNYTAYDGETLNWGGPSQSCVEGFQRCDP